MPILRGFSRSVKWDSEENEVNVGAAKGSVVLRQKPLKFLRFWGFFCVLAEIRRDYFFDNPFWGEILGSKH